MSWQYFTRVLRLLLGRTLLSDTAQLHRKLSEMSQRIRQLEDALEISHSTNSTAAHPLLREELLSIKRGVGPSTADKDESEPVASENLEDGSESIEEALGVLSISDRGVNRFIGRSGGSETLFLVRIRKMPVRFPFIQPSIAGFKDCPTRHRTTGD